MNREVAICFFLADFHLWEEGKSLGCAGYPQGGIQGQYTVHAHTTMFGFTHLWKKIKNFKKGNNVDRDRRSGSLPAGCGCTTKTSNELSRSESQCICSEKAQGQNRLR